ncbi:hypothetical protein NDU88_002513 [Pleurodeles waltl]|uniref:Reverse transcriptase domain-containing protein n=1 Tax=Pleurodeles waltl TaxID=8319 RepID=A0AAV7LEB1_PLEWA|nr:hypothetical protein NDU88_002513 [Pleurodeles waltl]
MSAIAADILAVEPLAALVHRNPAIAGIAIPGGQTVIYLYADEILLTLTDLTHSLPALRVILTEFKALAGYKINWEKSEALPLTPVTTHTAMVDA